MAYKISDHSTSRVNKLVRSDGFAGTAFETSGAIQSVAAAVSEVLTLTPPTPYCLAFYLVAAAAGGRYTFDGLTTATSTLGFPVATGGTPNLIYISPGKAISFANGATATTLTIQWYEGV